LGLGGKTTQISLIRLVAVFDELGIQVEVSYDGGEAATPREPDDVASGLAYEGMRRRGRRAAEIPGRPASVFDEHASVPGMDELRRQLEQPVVENCEATLSLL